MDQYIERTNGESVCNAISLSKQSSDFTFMLAKNLKF
jgi:hypothetical protein